METKERGIFQKNGELESMMLRKKDILSVRLFKSLSKMKMPYEVNYSRVTFIKQKTTY
jgi:hypothetical protein